MGKSKTVVAAILCGFLAFSVAACGSAKTTSAVCMDTKTQKRIADSRCGNNATTGSDVFWWYMAPGQVAPAIGQSASQGSRTAPAKTKVTYGGVAPKGGSVAKPNSSSGSSSKSGSGSVKSGSSSGGGAKSGGSVSVPRGK
ncbi:hypothetical protein PXH69_24580 [Rhodococcus qingshengii]|uniref:Lipoprotein n=1 Tax=Rhodococcus qingshengii TaxID=334542 RepID=A0AAW6LQU1_RHOSG|nr:hypothetical protein [Rhodococcus qingshengii]MDE8648148.1 hypothetical protein [Rhodococcus qingshengii]